VPVLRINDVSADPPARGQRRVEVTWQDGPIPRVAVSSFAYQVEEQDAEKIRWYLEDYAEFRADPAPRLALDAEARLVQIGTGLFRQVFSGQDAAGIWEQARNQLGQVRVEVDVDPADTPGLPWELLRDPGPDRCVALDAGAFVRTHLQAAVHPRLPEAAGDQLRVLLVICRPGGRADVPFRSVASRLVRGGAEKMEGLDLKVLRPATFARLSEVLHQAADVGRPYHVVHFDGHGTYLDLADLGPEQADGDDDFAADGGSGIPLSPLRYGVSVAGPVRAGQHGYLLFEDPASSTNQQLVDGPTLGRLLVATQVPVLVLNACRSAYTEAPERPGTPTPEPGDIGTAPSRAPNTGDEGSTGDAASGVPMDVHARIRAYGSLAAEVADVGVPGVVAMRYNVYVVTAAQFVADLYGHLLAGRSLGEAASAARRALARAPTRQIRLAPVALQDWAVPVIYEAASLTLLRPELRDAPLIRLSPSDADRTADSMTGGLTQPPDAGFFGRDETLLALDRAFDTQPLVLLHAYAGAGKSSTAAEFAHWYEATGGLDVPGHLHWEYGPVLWSSFEHHLPLDRLLDTAGHQFSGLLEANGIHWQAITSPAQRRDLILQVLAQVPVLWVWDNVEPVTGFPVGTSSDWTAQEQQELTDFLQDLTHGTRCKVLLTSRRAEHAWLGGLPARVQLPPMPMRERLQLAAALVLRHGQFSAEADWRPLLRYAGGNPLTITVLVGQARREHLTTTASVEAFVERLHAGEAALEAGEDESLGRSRSLAASLGYGFAHAFNDAERDQLALLHLFRDTVDVKTLWFMGDPEVAGEDAVPQLSGFTEEAGIVLLDRAADIGLLTPLGAGYYVIHPALPWYFTTVFTSTYGHLGAPGAERTARAFTRALGVLGDYYQHAHSAGMTQPAIETLGIEEANLQHALTLARACANWADAVGCLQGLSVLYRHTGRTGEWARLVRKVSPDYIDPATDEPLPGREDMWNVINSYRVQIAIGTRDWPTGIRLQHASVVWSRERAAAALATPDRQLTSLDRHQLHTLATSVWFLGDILQEQSDPDCLPHYEEALGLFQRIGNRTEEANVAIELGNVYLQFPKLRDLDQAERWYRHSLDRRADHDRLGQAKALGSIATATYMRFCDARVAGAAAPVALEHLNAALRGYHQALGLIPDGDLETRAGVHHQLGLMYSEGRATRQALHHYQQSVIHQEARGDIYDAGRSRNDIAHLLRDDGNMGDALLYARAALHDFQRVGPGAADLLAETQQLIADLVEREPGA
jgi:tetratricopeptide (TPR) repeat protein